LDVLREQAREPLHDPARKVVVVRMLENADQRRQSDCEPDRGVREPVHEGGAGLGRVDDRLLPVVVDRALEARHHAGAHLDADRFTLDG